MIREDKHYLSNDNIIAIERGFAKLDIHSIRISRENFTEEEKAENSRIYNTLTREEWSKRCEDTASMTASKIEPLVESLSKKFNIYQYKNDDMDYRSKWDLFFWCNGDNRGRDFSYVTLSTNDTKKLEERLLDIEHVLNYIKEIGFAGLDIAIQYSIKYDDEKLKEMASDYFEKIKNTVIEYSGYMGKIKDMGIDYMGNKCYGFFKKGARSKYYKVSNGDMAIMSIQQ